MGRRHLRFVFLAAVAIALSLAPITTVHGAKVVAGRGQQAGDADGDSRLFRGERSAADDLNARVAGVNATGGERGTGWSHRSNIASSNAGAGGTTTAGSTPRSSTTPTTGGRASPPRSTTSTTTQSTTAYQVKGIALDGGSPADAVIDDASTYAYITNPERDRIEVLDLRTGALRTPILVGPEPSGLDLSVDGKKLYVALRGSVFVSEVDVATRTELRRIPVILPYQNGELPNDRPDVVTVVSSRKVFIATTVFDASGKRREDAGAGGRMLELDPTTDDVANRIDYDGDGRTSVLTRMARTPDHQVIAAVTGYQNSPSTWLYSASTDRWSGGPVVAANDYMFNAVAISRDGAVAVANPGGHTFDADPQPVGRTGECNAGGITFGTTNDTIYESYIYGIVICRGKQYATTERIPLPTHSYTSTVHSEYAHPISLSPDGTVLVVLADSAVALVRL